MKNDSIIGFSIFAGIILIYGIAYYYDNKKSKIYWHDFLWLPVAIILSLKTSPKYAFLGTIFTALANYIIKWYKNKYSQKEKI